MTYGRSPAMDALPDMARMQTPTHDSLLITVLGLLDMDTAGLAKMRSQGIPEHLIITVERRQLFRKRSAAAKLGWATRRSRA